MCVHYPSTTTIQGWGSRSGRPGDRRTNILNEIASPTFCLQARSLHIICTDPCPHSLDIKESSFTQFLGIFSPGMVCNKILIHFPSACMEISVHQQFQDPQELCERATHASWSEFCLVLSQHWPTMCGHRTQNLLILRSPQLSFMSGLCGHGFVQMICRLLACKQNVGDAISIKILVRRSPGLPDLLRHPCIVVVEG